MKKMTLTYFSLILAAGFCFGTSPVFAVEEVETVDSVYTEPQLGHFADYSSGEFEQPEFSGYAQGEGADLPSDIGSFEGAQPNLGQARASGLPSFAELFSNCSCSYECYPNQFWLRHTEGKGLGYSDGYTTVGLFLSRKSSPNCLTFVDLRDHTFNSGRVAANIGAGLRYLNSCWDKVLGVNVFYDYYNKHHDYSQVGVGLEMLGNCYDVRINGYFPVGSTHQNFDKCCFRYPGGYQLKMRHREDALTGFDSEIGTYLNRYLCIPCQSLYAAAGPYYYGNRDHHFTGGRIRLAYQYNKYLGVELRSTYDDYFKGTFQGAITLTFPFGSFCCEDSCAESCCLPCYTQPVQRNDIIVTDKNRCCWRYNW